MSEPQVQLTEQAAQGWYRRASNLQRAGVRIRIFHGASLLQAVLEEIVGKPLP